MDAAVAELVAPAAKIAEPDIITIGQIAEPTKPVDLYMSVRKQGRTTRHTIGVVMDISADIKVRFGKNTAAFDDQIAIVGVGGLFSQGGDSGSLIVDAVTRQPVALLFAGGGHQTFACPIDPILERFQAQIIS
jgi:hypothetical protein